MKTDRKPPLARSPMRARTRRALKSSNLITPLRTPTVAMTKPQMKEVERSPEYQSIPCELSVFSKVVQDELGAMNFAFEKGPLYNEYIARRDERLRKKQSKIDVDEPKTAYGLGVKVESTKKDFKKKSMAVTYSVDRNQQSRYSLRSSVKKPSLPVPMYVEEEATTARKSVAVSRTRRK